MGIVGDIENGLEAIGLGETAGGLEHVESVNELGPIAGDFDEALTFAVEHRLGEIDLQTVFPRGETDHRRFEMRAINGGGKHFVRSTAGDHNARRQILVGQVAAEQNRFPAGGTTGGFLGEK